MLSEVGSSKGRSYAVEAPHTRLPTSSPNMSSRHKPSQFSARGHPGGKRSLRPDTGLNLSPLVVQPRGRVIAFAGRARDGNRPGGCLQSNLHMHSARIAELLQPFLSNPCHSEPGESREESAVLSATQLQNISTYIDILHPLERSHQPHRNPQRRRNRDPPLRRIPIRRPPFISEGFSHDSACRRMRERF